MQSVNDNMADKGDYEAAVRPSMAMDYAGINGDYHFTSDEGEVGAILGKPLLTIVEAYEMDTTVARRVLRAYDYRILPVRRSPAPG